MATLAVQPGERLPAARGGAPHLRVRGRAILPCPRGRRRRLHGHAQQRHRLLLPRPLLRPLQVSRSSIFVQEV